MFTSEHELVHIAAQKGPDVVFEPSTGLITHVGPAHTLRPEVATLPQQVLRIDGGMALPSFTDAHDHIVADAYSRVMRDRSLEGLTHKEAILDRIREECDARITEEPTGYAMFRGCDSNVLYDITAAELDEVSFGRPIVVFDPSNHGGVANTQVLGRVQEVLDEVGRTPSGEIETSGRITEGHASIAKDLAYEAVDDGWLLEGLMGILKERMMDGTTSVHEMGLRCARDLAVVARLKREWEAERAIPFPITRAYLSPQFRTPNPADQIMIALSRGDIEPEDFSWVGIKLFADGTFGSRTADLEEPYHDQPDNKSMTQFSGDTTIPILRDAAYLGVSEVAVHAIGDRAISLALIYAQIWKEFAQESRIDPNRFRIEHYELPLPFEVALPMTKHLNIPVSPQPNFLTDYAYADRLGPDRVRQINPLARMQEEGLTMLAGTDRFPPSVLFAIWASQNALFADQKLSLKDALRIFTETAADYEGVDRGRLRPGARADVLVADSSLFGTLQQDEDLILFGRLAGKPMKQERDQLIKDLDDSVKHVFSAGRQLK